MAGRKASGESKGGGWGRGKRREKRKQGLEEEDQEEVGINSLCGRKRLGQVK